MSKKARNAPTSISTAQMQDMARKSMLAGKGASVHQARGAHGGGKRDQHRQDRQDGNHIVRMARAGHDVEQMAPRRDRKNKSSMMKEVRKK